MEKNASIAQMINNLTLKLWNVNFAPAELILFLSPINANYQIK